MKDLAPFLLLSIFLYKALSMTCSDIPTQTKCGQLNGCFWTTSCVGTFNPPCVPPSCYYVDSYSRASIIEVGTPDNPVKSISRALNNLLNTTGTIIIMNYIDNVTAEVNQAHTLSGGTTTIKPLFAGSLYNLDFSKIPVPTSSTTSFLKVTSSAILIVNGGIANFTFTGNQYMFDNSNSVIMLQNFHVVDCSGTKGTMVRTSSSGSIFIHDGGLISNNSVKYSLAGTATFKNMNIIDAGNISSYISSSGTLVVDCVKARGGSGTVAPILFVLSKNSNVTIQNSIFESGNFSVLSSSGAKTIIITNTTFQNMTLKSTLLTLKDISSSGSAHTIEDCIFRNINTSSSIISLERNGMALNMNRVQMVNIRKPDSEEDLSTDWQPGICVMARDETVITISNSNFTNIYTHCLGIKESVITISYSNFSNSDFEHPKLTKNAINSLNDKSGVTWLRIDDTTGIVPDGHTITLTGNRFIKNNAISKYGGAIRFIGVLASQIYAVDNEFIGNTAYYGGAIYSSNNLLSLNFSNNNFTENSAYDGGAIYKKSIEFKSKSYESSIVLFGDQFTRNIALRNGGAMNLDWESLQMQETTFTQCTAQNGGAIYFINLDKYFNNKYGYIKDSHFFQNNATVAGGALKLFFSFTDLKEDPSDPAMFISNEAYQGNDISSDKPSYYLISFYDVLLEKTFDEIDDLSEWVTNTTRTRLAFSINTTDTPENLEKNRLIHKSGHEVSQIIVIEIMDSEGEALDFIKNEEISVKLFGNENTVSTFTPFLVGSPVTLTFYDGKIYIKKALQIVGEPKTTATLNFRGIQSSSNILKDANLLLNFNITVYFQDCEVGDIFNEEARTCDTCATGTYSLSDPYQVSSCIECDSPKAQCLGGSKIAVLPGYWRSSANSTNILECPAKEACLGGLLDEKFYVQGVCGEGYEGNLCDKCMPEYAKFGSSDECMDCRRDVNYYLKLVGFFSLKLIVVIYSIKVNLDKVNLSKKAHGSSSVKLNKKIQNTDFQSNLIKIVVNFVQVSSLIIQYRFEWPDLIRDILNVTNKFIPTDSDGFSIDCLVAIITKNNRYLFFVKLVITLIQPFGIWIALTIGYIVILKIKKERLNGNPKLIKNIMVLFVITAFIIQPSIVQETLEAFKCQNLRDYKNPIYYMTKDSEVQCWTPFHLMWSVGIALPFFLLWGVFLPLALLRKLKATQKNLQDPEVCSRFAFVYAGLHTKRYYWEFINLLRKNLLIIIFVFLNIISVHIQAFATFLVLFFFGLAHIRYCPYQDKKLNQLELFSFITLGVMNYSGMFFLSGGSTSFTTLLLLVIAIACNILFFSFTLVYFIRSYKDAAKLIARKVSFKINRSLSRIDSKKNIESDCSIIIEKKNKPTIDTLNTGHLFTDSQPNQNPTEVFSPKPDLDNSHIPSEEGTDRSDRKTVYAERKEEANYSIMKNSGYSSANLLRKSFVGNQIGSQVGLQSFGNSSLGPFSPNNNQRLSFLNTDRFSRHVNTLESHPEDNLETQPPSSNDRFRLEPEDFHALTGRQSTIKLDVTST